LDIDNLSTEEKNEAKIELLLKGKSSKAKIDLNQ